MPKKSNKKRTDGRIAVQVYLGMVDGKRKYKTVYGATQKEANAKAEEIKMQIGKGIDITADNDTFGKWAEQWLALKKLNVCNQQYVVYKSCTEHLSPLKNYKIGKIRTCDIQMIINQLASYNPNTGKEASKRLLKMLIITSSQIFELAITNRLIDYNPARSVIMPNCKEPNERRALTADEQQMICDTPHRAQTAAMIMMYAGLRRGELLALTWSDIDLEARTITVNKSVEYISGKPHVKSGAKTESGTRIVDIPQKLADYLARQERKTINVCVNTRGNLYSVSGWRNLWDSYLKELNAKYYNPLKRSKFDPKGIPMMIPPITPHWLRHTYATLLYQAGVDVLTAKEQLGHSDIKTTLNIYTHLDKIHKRKSMSKLDDFLNQNSDASHMQVSEN